MEWETHPVTPDRFEDFADVISRSRRPTHCCCCLSPLLDVGSTVLAVAAGQLPSSGYGSFLCPDAAHDAVTRHVRITTLGCPPEGPQYLTAVVLLSPPGDLHGLTDRELVVLGLLVEGWSNRQIATALYITQRTVAAHVEHILPKLGTPTRTLAAVRALRLGLYVPFALAVI